MKAKDTDASGDLGANREALAAQWHEEQRIARIIEWEFPSFSVEKCLRRRYRAQEMLEKDGCLQGRIHRLLLVARKPA